MSSPSQEICQPQLSAGVLDRTENVIMGEERSAEATELTSETRQVARASPAEGPLEQTQSPGVPWKRGPCAQPGGQIVMSGVCVPCHCGNK